MSLFIGPTHMAYTFLKIEIYLTYFQLVNSFMNCEGFNYNLLLHKINCTLEVKIVQRNQHASMPSEKKFRINSTCKKMLIYGSSNVYARN